MKNLIGQWVQVKEKYKCKHTYIVHKIIDRIYSYNEVFYKIQHHSHTFLIRIDNIIERFNFVPELRARLYE